MGWNMVLRADWKARAKCKNLPSVDSDNVFFYESGQKSNRAKRFCTNCPVKQECLNYAILYREKGVWAGTTDEDREALHFLRDMLFEKATSENKLENRNYRKWLAIEIGEESIQIIDDLNVNVDFGDDSFVLDPMLFEAVELLNDLESSASNNERLAG